MGGQHGFDYQEAATITKTGLTGGARREQREAEAALQA